MRLVTFSHDNRQNIGALDPETGMITDLSKADPSLPTAMINLIALGDEGLAKAAAAVASAPPQAQHRQSDVKIMAPIPVPLRNVMCVGRNYHEHAKEFHDSGFDATADKTSVPEVPIIFTKPPTSVIGPGDAIPSHLDPTNSVDYEGELAVVIGREGRGISKAEAFDHVYGYTVINDVTARTLQLQHKQWFIGKSLDGFCPMGPVLLTADEAGAVEKFHLVTKVNGETRQDAMLADLIFDIPTLIETLSVGITLKPGDVIATGTPAGVGIGFDPPKYLKPGDVVAVTIEPIGTLENRVE